MAFRKEFAGHNVNAAGQGVTREELVPRAKSVEGGIMATWKGLVKSLRIVGGGENGTASNNNLVVSNGRSMKALARKGASRCGHKRNQVLDRNNNVGVLVIVVAFLDIRRKEMMAKLVCRHRHRHRLGDCSRWPGHNRWPGRQWNGAGRRSVCKDRTQPFHTQHVVLIGKDQIQIISFEVGMELEVVGLHNDLHKSLLVVNGFLESFFNTPLCAKTAGCSLLVRIRHATELACNGGETGLVAFTRWEKFLDLFQENPKKVGMEMERIIVKEVAEDGSNSGSTGVQQIIGEGDENTVQAWKVERTHW
jgi:hypothetical protein